MNGWGDGVIGGSTATHSDFASIDISNTAVIGNGNKMGDSTNVLYVDAGMASSASSAIGKSSLKIENVKIENVDVEATIFQ